MTIDDRAREAAARLRADVDAQTDTEAALTRVLAGPGRRGGWLPSIAAVAAAAAVLAVAAGVVVRSDDAHDDGEEVVVDVDPDPEDDGTALQLLAPDDGRQSLGLPVTVEPAEGLVDGDTIHVVASGFEPGESVGIVQCAAEAREPVYAGVTACRISPFTQVTADADGAVEGEFTVSRSLTVPFSGTVDCAVAPGTCLIGVGALANYDRSGGMSLTFAPADDTVVRPSVEVSEVADLADGQVVRVTGTGFVGGITQASVCATSPATCWNAGLPDVDVDEANGVDGPYGNAPVAGDGTIDVDVSLWRFLPGQEPGTYVDCALSVCSLRFTGELAPPPVALTFRGDEPPPQAPEVAVAPATGLRPGSAVTISGSGFGAGAQVYVSVCANQPAIEASGGPGLGMAAYGYCLQLPEDGTPSEVDGDGGFTLDAVLPDFDTSRFCDPDAPADACPAITSTWTFDVEVHVADFGFGFATPTFGALPVRIEFTP